MLKKFWNWTKKEKYENILYLNFSFIYWCEIIYVYNI